MRYLVWAALCRTSALRQAALRQPWHSTPRAALLHRAPAPRAAATRNPALRGEPVGPEIDAEVVLRYAYEGATLSQGRLVLLPNPSSERVAAIDLLRALEADGVDLQRFYATVYETKRSAGAWLPVLRDLVELPPLGADPPPAADDFVFCLEEHVRPLRIDVQLCRRQGDSAAALASLAEADLCGKLGEGSYHAIGVLNTKNQASVGTLWRSAYQLGAAFIFTTGTRYRQQPTDTLKTDSRLPLFELDDWSQFAQFAPSRCKWVAVEMCGRRLRAASARLRASRRRLPSSKLRGPRSRCTWQGRHAAAGV